MIKLLDDFLNNITMYRLVLYFLLVLAGVGLLYSFFGVLPYDPINYIFSFTFILVAAYITNWIFAKVFEAPTNVESIWISALILGLIITPPKNLQQVIFIGFAATLAMAGKFIFAIRKKHIFNPVALAVAITAFAINGSASWWVGNISMLLIVAIGGFLIVRKIRRWDLVLAFLAAALLTIGPSRWPNILNHSPIIFFAAIMITEPLTTPPTRILRIIYGAVVGFLFAPQIHLGSLFTTPELALIAGNIFAYIVSPKYKLILRLISKTQLTPDTYDFVFTSDEPVRFTPGQYMEFTMYFKNTLPDKGKDELNTEPKFALRPKSRYSYLENFTFEPSGWDSRGNRRYLSLASSPTEPEIRLGIKFGNPPSSFKQNLLMMNPNQKIAAGQLIGDFTLPKDPNKKLVLIAGGIGITPYRSMIKYLIDTNQKRDIVLIYSAKTKEEFVYNDVIDQATSKIGMRVIYNDSAVHGHLNAEILRQEIPDFASRTFYISGSHGVVTAFEDVLKQLQIPRRQIITDYFPGFA